MELHVGIFHGALTCAFSETEVQSNLNLSSPSPKHAPIFKLMQPPTKQLLCSWSIDVSLTTSAYKSTGWQKFRGQLSSKHQGAQ